MEASKPGGGSATYNECWLAEHSRAVGSSQKAELVGASHEVVIALKGKRTDAGSFRGMSTCAVDRCLAGLWMFYITALQPCRRSWLWEHYG